MSFVKYTFAGIGMGVITGTLVGMGRVLYRWTRPSKGKPYKPTSNNMAGAVLETGAAIAAEVLGSVFRDGWSLLWRSNVYGFVGGVMGTLYYVKYRKQLN
ncbi:Transmembrane domain-containing protein [Orpheovirus IHUMI-LCC2]|uniref:Transmembrane domain-containing protein n=1 Tax=Orpheovirus IHUMI-LCC2 TaxID=2023057 RepID=A0A2I2L472_9VIRU|nr:Transmembrane domain-containing protein [Orpheovirus IHUMI-LCC2]SNW62311.1 Transmembrane domain-containing protein [Orpheovirus IHUMI-LCC2]